MPRVSRNEEEEKERCDLLLFLLAEKVVLLRVELEFDDA